MKILREIFNQEELVLRLMCFKVGEKVLEVEES
jgi:hypothetical protein